MANGEDLIGTRIGKLKILDRLGHGKTSTIFRAYYKPLQKEVAVKILKEDAKATPELREKFLNEARALAQLDHENIVKIFDVVEADGYLMIIMQLLKGRDLWEVLKEDGRVEPERALEIVEKVARALESAHREGIVHRDVKPANIMIAGRREEVKLLDFGLAARGVVKGQAGTPYYMSPEQIQGKRVDEKTDIYSLGATLFHMLTGSPPYTGKTAKEIKEKHLKGDLPTTSRANREAGVPKAVDPVVKRMMAPVPGYRFTAKDLASTLDGLNLQAGGRRRHTRSARAAARKGPGPVVIGGAIGAVAVVAVVLVILLGGGKKNGPAKSGGGEVATGTAGNQEPGSAINPNRANDRQVRENQARRAYNVVQEFVRLNPEKFLEQRARYEKIWDDYGDTSWGEKAHKESNRLKAVLEEDKRRAKEIAEEKERREGRPAFDLALSGALEAYDFDKAEETIKEWIDRFEQEDKDLVERFNRIEYAKRFFDVLAEEINRNTKKYPVSLFKSGVPDEAILVSADADGVLIREGENDRKEPWSYFKPDEISRLAQRQMSLRDYKNLYYLSSFHFVMGEKDQGEDWLMSAKGADKFGWVDEQEKKVKPK